MIQLFINMHDIPLYHITLYKRPIKSVNRNRNAQFHEKNLLKDKVFLKLQIKGWGYRFFIHTLDACGRYAIINHSISSNDPNTYVWWAYLWSIVYNTIILGNGITNF